MNRELENEILKMLNLLLFSLIDNGKWTTFLTNFPIIPEKYNVITFNN